MFNDIPINTQVQELTSIEIPPTEKEDSDIFTFDYKGSGGGVIKLNTSYMSAHVGLRFDNAQLDNDTICDFIPHPLKTWFKSVKVSLNKVTTTNSNTENLHVSSIIDMLYKSKVKNNNMAGWRNVPGQEAFLATIRPNNVADVKELNKPGFKRIECFRGRNSVYVIEDLLVAFFGARIQYLPTNQRYTIKFTKDTSRRIFTGSKCEGAGAAADTDSDFHVANVHDRTNHLATYNAVIVNRGQHAANLANLDRVKSIFRDFRLNMKRLTPNAQIQQEISSALDVQGKLMNVFYQEIHVTTNFHDLTNSKCQRMNIFSGNVPYVMVMTLIKADYVNGNFYYPPTYFTWEHISDITVKVNNIPVCYKIKNSKDAYFHTRRALYLDDDEEMFVPYEFYEDGNAIVILELNPTKDSNLKVLPMDTKKNVDVEITFSPTGTGNVYIKFMGFLNQVGKVGSMKMTFKQLAI